MTAPRQLKEEQHRVLRLGETEPGGSGEYLYHFEPGLYHCVGCEQPLFGSEAKFDSGTGWPAFSQCLDQAIVYADDPLHGMKRLEAKCARCEGHLGHFFDDIDSISGKRFCINSVCLEFVPRP
jgi:peptide-methionine (R)-S-oxide reductase